MPAFPGLASSLKLTERVMQGQVSFMAFSIFPLLVFLGGSQQAPEAVDVGSLFAGCCWQPGSDRSGPLQFCAIGEQVCRWIFHFHFYFKGDFQAFRVLTLKVGE